MRFPSLFGFLITLLSLMAVSLPAKSSDLLVITGSSQTNELNLQQVRHIFNMRMQSWPNGQRLTIATLPNTHETHQKLVRDLLETNQNQLEQNWTRRIFSGRATAPIKARNESELFEILQQNPYAIGYVSRNTPLPDHIQIVFEYAL